eukprot:365495-Chlamydomonas_euryale.AAC.10
MAPSRVLRVLHVGYEMLVRYGDGLRLQDALYAARRKASTPDTLVLLQVGKACMGQVVHGPCVCPWGRKSQCLAHMDDALEHIYTHTHARPHAQTTHTRMHGGEKHPWMDQALPEEYEVC